MRINDTQLLCTFFNIRDRQQVLDEITSKYILGTDKVYLMKTDDGRFFYSYNVDKKLSINDKMKRTIMVHRKKETNTFFSINSLNELQKIINNGVSDRNQEINWENYRNKMLLFSDNILSVNEVSIYDVITIRYIDKNEIRNNINSINESNNKIGTVSETSTLINNIVNNTSNVTEYI